jgi:hypothetical protein
MFGLLMIFGQLWAEPWYGKNSSLMQRLTAGPYHVKLPRRSLLSVSGTIAWQVQMRAALNLGDEPQRASRRHHQTDRVGADDALPLAALH